MPDHWFFIPEHIDPMDETAARSAGRELMRSLDALLCAAMHTRGGGTVAAGIPLTLVWQVDSALTEASYYHVLAPEVHELAKELRWKVLRGVMDARQDPVLAKKKGWTNLWDEYHRVHDRPLVPHWGLRFRRGEMAMEKGELIGNAVVDIDPLVLGHPWHPKAWPFIVARFRPHDRERLLGIPVRLLVHDQMQQTALQVQQAPEARTNGPALRNLPQLSAVETNSGHPRWDRTTKTLTFGGRQHKYVKTAKAQFALLDLLEENDWPPGGVHVPPNWSFSVKDTIESLNPRTMPIGLSFQARDKQQIIDWTLSS
jgi:hypothetical protein